MRFYRIHLTNENGVSVGYRFFTRIRDVRKCEREHLAQNRDPEDPEGEPAGAPFAADIEIIYVKPTRAGIVTALNEYAAHADNG